MSYLGIIPLAAMIALASHRKIEEAFAPTVLGITLVMYVSGLVGILLTGFRILLAAGFVCAAGCIAMLIVRRREGVASILSKEIFTPGLLLYVIALTIGIFLDKGRVVTEITDLARWGFDAKAAYFYNNLLTRDGAWSLLPEDPPAFYVFAYYCLHFGRDFYENMLFHTHEILLISFILPLMQTVKGWRDWRGAFWKAFLVISLPALISRTAYSTLSIDVIAGTLTAYILMCWLMVKHDGFIITCMALGMAVLPLMDDMGVFLAAAILFIMVADLIKRRGSRAFPGILKQVFFCGAAASVAALSWYLFLNFTEGERSIPYLHGLAGIEVNRSLHEAQMLISSDELSLKELLLLHPEKFSLGIPVFVFILAALIICLLLYRQAEKMAGNAGLRTGAERAIRGLLYLCVFFLAFFVIVTIYILKVPEAAVTLRYADNMVCWMSAIAVLAVQTGLIVFRRDELVQLVMLLGILIFTDYYALGLPAVEQITRLPRRAEYPAYSSSNIAGEMNDRIFFVSQNEAGYLGNMEEYLGFMYEVCPNVVNRSSFNLQWLGEFGFQVALTPNDLLNEMIAGQYEYLYLYRIDDYFVTAYGGLFPSLEDIHEGSLYKVYGLNGKEEFRIELFSE